MSKVIIIRCNSYEEDDVKKAVQKGISLLGGIEQFVKPDEKILLKPNILIGEVPDKCVTTHPSVFKGVAELFLSISSKVFYGDSPAFGSPLKAANKCKIAQEAKKLNIPIADFENGKHIFFEKGIQNKKFFIAKGALECDGIISIPKFKTHGLEKITGCIKNQFGCIPGLLKAEFHSKIPNKIDLAKMLIDLNNFLKPRLYIMDGIKAMEGNGPRQGNPKQMNVLLFSKDPVALDSIMCRLININPSLIPTIVWGEKMGAGYSQSEQIELFGDPIDSFIDNSFKIDRFPIEPMTKSKILKFLNHYFVQKPEIIHQKCKQCGLCIDICPVTPKAISWKEKIPIFNYNQCIRCYCCHELCPHQAIKLKSPVLRKIFRK